MKYWIFVCVLLGASRGIAQWKIKVRNPSNIERKEELVTLSRARLSKLTGTTDAQYAYVRSNGKYIDCQKVDSNGDGRWDELVFLDDFAPNETKSIEVNDNKVRLKSVESFAHARLKPKSANDSFGSNVPFLEMPPQNPPTDFSKNPLPPYLTEGPALENDKNAFRLYFDTRNTKDIYGKRQPRLVMDSVGSNTKHSYHNLSDWGMDILHVEKSLGAGSLALLTHNENAIDTLIRLAGKDIVKESYTLLNDGPIYASFRMDYDWNVLGKMVHVQEMMCIWKGQYCYESDIAFFNAPANSVLVTGIADFYENRMDSLKTEGATALYSYGKQSENKDELGMAIVVSARDFAFIRNAPKANSDITRSHLIGQYIKSGRNNRFRFYSCWSKTDSSIAGTENDFSAFLQKEMVKISEPLEILQ